MQISLHFIHRCKREFRIDSFHSSNQFHFAVFWINQCCKFLKKQFKKKLVDRHAFDSVFKNELCFDLPLFSKYTATSLNSYFYKMTLHLSNQREMLSLLPQSWTSGCLNPRAIGNIYDPKHKFWPPPSHTIRIKGLV